MMGYWNTTGGVIWTFFWAFAFVAYLFALFAVVADLFRDHRLSGWAKALWILFLIFVPFVTVLVYLIARAPGMAERRERDLRAAEAAAGGRFAHAHSAAEEIEKAKVLLDAGSITPSEYERLKEKALGA